MERGELEIVVVDGDKGGKEAGEDEEESCRSGRLTVREDSVKGDADCIDH